MYAICNTIQGDVADAVKAMNEKGYKYPIFQIGQRVYSRLEKQRGGVYEKVEAKNAKHVVNLTTGTLHKKGCPALKKAKNKVGAYIVNPAATGLKTCKVCM
jgi:hypothetical protein